MAEKKYSADDIKIIKPGESHIDLVDISRPAFEKKLVDSATHALEFTRTLVTNTLPDKIRYVVRLGASYDGNPLEDGEVTFPIDYDERERIYDSSQEVADLLWREGRVPEWINVTVLSETPGYTNVKLECCGRFSDKPEQIYHAHEGRAPFHVFGPPIPQGVDISKGEKYQL